MKQIEVIKFWADWCVPCKHYGDMMLTVKPEFPEVKFRSIDVEEDVEATEFYGIRSLPTTVITVDGEVVAKLVGAKKREELVEALTEVVTNN